MISVGVTSLALGMVASEVAFRKSLAYLALIVFNIFFLVWSNDGAGDSAEG